MTKKPKGRIAATMTLHRVSDMTPKGRKDIAIWLRHCAASVLRHGPNFAKRFTASYRYEGKP